MRRSLPLLLLCLTLAFATFVRGESWPQFRGPGGQGHADVKGLPIHWSDTQNVAWKTALPGSGWSSPVYADGRLYLTAAVPVAGGDKGDLSLRTFCLDARSGKMLWNVDVFTEPGASSPHIHSKNSHASPTPLLEGGRLYVHFGHEGTACLDLNGKVIWQNRSLHYPPVHGNGGSPVLVGDALIFSCDGARDPFIVALHRDSGKVLWKTPRRTDARKKFSFSTPLVIEVAGHKQVISPGSDMVCAFDPDTGREIWRVRYDGYSVIPRPVFGHGLLFICTGFDRPSLMAIRPDGATGDVTATHVAWTTSRNVPHTPSLLLVGDELYMVADGGFVSCLDARTGEEHYAQRVQGNYSASPLYADGRIYIQSEQGVGAVLKAGLTFEQLASNPLGERTLASYAVGDGALFIRSAEHLFRIQDQK